MNKIIKELLCYFFCFAESTGLTTTQIISAPFNAFPFRLPRGPLQKNCGKRRKRQIFLFAHFLPTNKFEPNVQIKRDVVSNISCLCPFAESTGLATTQIYLLRLTPFHSARRGGPCNQFTAQEVASQLYLCLRISSHKQACSMICINKEDVVDIFLLRFLFAESTGLTTTQITSASFNAFPFRSPRGPLQPIHCARSCFATVSLFMHFISQTSLFYDMHKQRRCLSTSSCFVP